MRRCAPEFGRFVGDMKRSLSTTADGAGSCRKVRRDGPLTFEGVLRWAADNLEALRAHDLAPAAGISLESGLLKNMSRGVVLTTSYSGQGTAEFAAAELRRVAAAADARCVPDMRMHSASEHDPLAQRVLLSHDPRSAPAHVFGHHGKGGQPHSERAAYLAPALRGQVVWDTAEGAHGGRSTAASRNHR